MLSEYLVRNTRLLPKIWFVTYDILRVYFINERWTSEAGFHQLRDHPKYECLLDRVNLLKYIFAIESFHMTLRRPHWWPKPILWEWDSFLIKHFLLVQYICMATGNVIENAPLKHEATLAKVPNGAWTQSSRSEYNPTTPACVSRYWKMEEKFALMENLTKFLWEDALSKSGLLKRVNRHHAIVREALGTRYKRGQQFSIAWNVAACIVVNFTAWRDHVRFIWKKKLQLALHMTINCWQRVESAQIRIGMQLVFQRKMTFLTRLRDISVLFAGIICGGYRKYSKPM